MADAKATGNLSIVEQVLRDTRSLETSVAVEERLSTVAKAHAAERQENAHVMQRLEEAKREAFEERLLLKFHMQRDGRIVSHTSTGKVVFLHEKYADLVHLDEPWEVGIHHRFRVCVGYPLVRLSDDTVTLTDTMKAQRDLLKEVAHDEKPVPEAVKANALVERLNSLWGNEATRSLPVEEAPKKESQASISRVIPSTPKPLSPETIAMLEAARPKFQRSEPNFMPIRNDGKPSVPKLPDLSTFESVLKTQRCVHCSHIDCEFYRSGRVEFCRGCFKDAGGEIKGMNGAKFRREGGYIKLDGEKSNG